MSNLQSNPPKVERAIRAAILHCKKNVTLATAAEATEYLDDGLLLIGEGKVLEMGPAPELLGTLAGSVEIEDQRGRLLVPGFVDTHVHFAQTDIIASHGEQLLDWLRQYAWPAEMRFADPQVCHEVAQFFLQQLLANGTTTACVFATVHQASVEALFEAAARYRLRLIAGKVLMDRNCPEALAEHWQKGVERSAELIDRWHGKDRLAYALTPRFAPTSSREQLASSGELLGSRPGLYLQTHLAENRAECAWVAELFPTARSYLDVYDQAGLVGERSVFAHGIHIDDEDRRRLATSASALSFCPTSNLFLGSGLFNYSAAVRAGVRIGLGTDVGAGTRFGLPATAAEAYKVARLQDYALDPFEALYLATLGGARALHLDDRIGNFTPGKEADCVLLDYNATPLVARRIAGAADLADKLFALLMLGDERVVAATYVLGEKVYDRSGE